MKKILMALCAILLVVGLTGCDDATTNVSDKKVVMIKVGKSKITKGDVYTCLTASGDVSDVTEKINAALMNKAVETTKEIEKEAKEDLNDYKKSIGKDKWEDYYKNLGYETEEEFLEQQIMPEIKANHLQEQYVNDAYDTLVQDLEPRKLQICQITDSKNQEKAQKMIANGKSIEDVAKKYGDTKTYKVAASLYTNKSGLPLQVWSEIVKLEKGKTSDPIIDTDTTYAYIVKAVETDASAMEKEVKAHFNTMDYVDADGLSLSDSIFKYYLKQNKFGVYDAVVYAALLQDSTKYKRD